MRCVFCAGSRLISSTPRSEWAKARPRLALDAQCPMNKRALETMQQWALQFPDRKAAHFVFPSEKVGICGNDEIPEVFDTDPTKAISSWKTAWKSAKTAAGITCRFHDLRHTTVTRLLERGQAFAVVADLMGWSAATAVRMAKRYGHIGPSAKRSAMAALDSQQTAGAAAVDRGANARCRTDDPPMTEIRGGHKIGHSRGPRLRPVSR